MNGSSVVLLLLASLDLVRSEQIVTSTSMSDDAITKEFVAHLHDFLRKAGSDDYWKHGLPSCSAVDMIAFRAEHLNSMTDMVYELIHATGQGDNATDAHWQSIDDVLRRTDAAVAALNRDVVNNTRSTCYYSREFREYVYVPLVSQTMVTLCVVQGHGDWKRCGTVENDDDDHCSLERVKEVLNCSTMILPYLESQSQREGPKHRQRLLVASGNVRLKEKLVQEMLDRMYVVNNSTLTGDLRVAIDYYLKGLVYLSSNYRKVMHPKEFSHHNRRSSWQLVKHYSVRRFDHNGRSVGPMNDWFSGYRQFLSSILDSFQDAPLDTNMTLKYPVWTNDSIFVDSPCLCHLSHYDNCNMWTRTRDDEVSRYCLAVLLENLQSAATVRMVISFLDYSLAKKVSSCALKSFLVGPVRDEFCLNVVLDPIQQVTAQHGSNWSVPELTSGDNKASLCLALEHLSKTDDCTNLDPSSPQHEHLGFYIYRHAGLQIAFVVADVATRVASLVVYLSISELKNLPGKCFIAFQLTSLVNSLFVRYMLPECKVISLQVLVYLENFLTLSSSFWLNVFCTYLYHCFATMTLPNSLCARKVSKIFWKFFSYATLSPALFTLICMVTDFTNGAVGVGSSYSAYEYGKVAFFVANFAALLSNLVIYSVFVVKISRVRKEVEKVILRRNPDLQKKFTELLHFTTKVFVLSSAGFLARTLIYQMEDIERWINVVYLGSLLEGPLIFNMFVCNRETKRLVFNKVHHVPSGKTSKFYVKCHAMETLNVRTSNWVTYRHSGISVIQEDSKRELEENEII